MYLVPFVSWSELLLTAHHFLIGRLPSQIYLCIYSLKPRRHKIFCLWTNPHANKSLNKTNLFCRPRALNWRSKVNKKHEIQKLKVSIIFWREITLYVPYFVKTISRNFLFFCKIWVKFVSSLPHRFSIDLYDL